MTRPPEDAPPVPSPGEPAPEPFAAGADAPPASAAPEPPLELSERQRQVLAVVAGGYVADPRPIGSKTVSHVLPTPLSAASIRNTMADLTDMGLLEKPHASAGRVPTARGLRHFVETLLHPGDLGPWDRRRLARDLDEVLAAAGETALRRTSELLTDQTGQLGFVLLPGLDGVVVRHVSLVRLSTERLLAVVVGHSGKAHQRVIDDPGAGTQSELDRMATLLTERLAGQRLGESRHHLARELAGLRDRADRLVFRALEVGLRMSDQAQGDGVDLVVATRLALLDQPEFGDPVKIRDLFAALEAQEQLVEVLERIVSAAEVTVTFGEDLRETGLHPCALVAAPYGGGESGPARGAVGVIGPSRMDYARIIPLVGYCSRHLTEALG